jgi:hypothetical protein
MLNLYDYYEEPDTLPLYDTVFRSLHYIDAVHNWDVSVFKRDLEPILGVIIKKPKLAFYYADTILKARWPECEKYLITSPTWSYQYAKYIIKGRWPEAEPIIATDPGHAVKYATQVIRGRFPEAEPYILKGNTPFLVYDYAKYVINGPWPEGEHIILQDLYTTMMYIIQVLKRRWPEAETHLKGTGYWSDYTDRFDITE